MVRIFHGDIYTTDELFNVKRSLGSAMLDEGRVGEMLREAFARAGHPLSSDADVAVESGISNISGEPIKRVTDGDRDFLVAFHEQRLHIYPNNFQIIRKPERKLRAMLHLVHDSDHVAELLYEAGMPLRWGGEPVDGAESAWSTDDFGRTYRADAGEAIQWLRYRHRQPNQWRLATSSGRQAHRAARSPRRTDHRLLCLQQRQQVAPPTASTGSPTWRWTAS